MMKKRLLVLGGLVVVIGLLVVLTRGGLGGEKTTVCQSFLTAVQANDAKKSYGMFSDRAQGTLELGDWEKQVPIYRTAYGQQKPELIGDANNTSLTSTAANLTEQYIMTNGENKYTATCYLQRTGNSYSIEGFASEPRYETEQE